MKFVTESIEIARALFPSVYKQKEKGVYRTFHWAFAWRKNHLLAISQNSPHEISGKAITLAKKFRSYHSVRFPYLHAEIALIGKLWSRYFIDNSLRIVVIRLNVKGELRDSKPCKHCQKILDALGVTKIFYSTNGKVVKLEN